MKEEKIGKKLTPKQELFCQLYVKNQELFGNGTLSYAAAYNKQLDGLSKEKILNVDTGKYGDSEYDRLYNNCSSCASVLLRNLKITERINQLFREVLTEEAVDTELSKVIHQSKELGSKVSAIREFNKLKGRITDQVTDPVGNKAMQELNENLVKIFEDVKSARSGN